MGVCVNPHLAMRAKNLLSDGENAIVPLSLSGDVVHDKPGERANFHKRKRLEVATPGA